MALAGIDGVNAASRYSLALPAFMLAGWALLRESEHVGAERKRDLRFLTLILFATGLSAALFVPKAPFFPASILNTETFSAVTGLPIEVFYTGCGLAAALGIWRVQCRNEAKDGEADWFRRWLIPGAAVLLLACGFVVAEWCGRIADSVLRTQLLTQAAAISRTIDVKALNALSFTSVDKALPQFQRLRSQMAAYAEATRIRSIYSVAMRGGTLVFGPESLAENDPLSSPPGTVYREPPAGLHEIFRRGLPHTLGPYKDEYGSFVSAFAPVLDARTGKTVLLIGIDLEAKPYQATLARARLIPILFTVVLILILLAGWGLLNRRTSLPADRQGRLRYIETMTVAAIGLALTFYLTYQVHNNQTQLRWTRFLQLAEERAESVVRTIQEIRVHALTGLSRFFETDEEVSREEFFGYTESLAHTSAVEAWGWAPFVPAHEKGRVEARARREGLTDFAIYQKGASGNLTGRIPAAGRDAYYPVFYVEPRHGFEAALGYDLGSESTRRAALEEAVRTRLPTITDPVTLVVGDAMQKGSLVFQPVFANPAKPDQAREQQCPPCPIARGYDGGSAPGVHAQQFPGSIQPRGLNRPGGLISVESRRLPPLAGIINIERGWQTCSDK